MVNKIFFTKEARMKKHIIFSLQLISFIGLMWFCLWCVYTSKVSIFSNYSRIGQTERLIKTIEKQNKLIEELKNNK